MEIVQMLAPANKYSIKCPYTMIPEGITVHNTANDASAKNEVSYMITNNYKTSFHYAVDDVRAVQGVPLDRMAWHAGDGRGFGNMKTIGIEICYSKSGGERFENAEKNAAELIARLMLQYGWGPELIGTKTINTHQSRSGKYCPHRTLDMGLERFWNIVRQKYSELSGTAVAQPSAPQPAPAADSYRVKITTSALRIREGAGTNTRQVGTITDGGIYTIVETQGNWGKLLSGDGWICLDYTTRDLNLTSKPSKPVVTPAAPKYSTGSYTVTASLLRVRQGPGTNYGAKAWYQLTKNAQEQNRRRGNSKANGLLNGCGCSVSEVRNGSWGRIPSGWISLDYCKKQ